MKGSIRTKEHCPVCKGRFTAVKNPRNRETIDIWCPGCQTRPGRFFIDGRYLRDRHGSVGQLFTDKDGQPFDSFGTAYKVLNAIRKEMDDGTFLSSRWNASAVKQYTIETLCEKWLQHIEREKSKTYAWHSRHFFAVYINERIGSVDVRTLRGIDINNFGACLSEIGISLNTQRGILTALRSCLNWLKRMDVIDRVPAFPPLSSVPRAHVGWIEPEEQARGIDLLREDMRLLVETMFALGARPAEACALKVRDLRDGAVRVERALDRDRKIKATKTGAIAEKVISPDLFRRLVAATAGKLPEAWLFTNKAGKPFHPRQVSWEWTKAAKAAGISACLYVASRHSRVSQLRIELEKRVAEELRRELAHRSSVVTLKHYVREKEGK